MKQTINQIKQDLITCVALASGVMATITGVSFILIEIFGY
jgi:hypothetical protein